MPVPKQPPQKKAAPKMAPRRSTCSICGRNDFNDNMVWSFREQRYHHKDCKEGK